MRITTPTALLLSLLLVAGSASAGASGVFSVPIYAERPQAMNVAITAAELSATHGLRVRIDNTGLQPVRRYSVRARALRADGTLAGFSVRRRDTLIEVNGGLVTTLSLDLTKEARYLILELAADERELPILTREPSETALGLLFSTQYARVDRWGRLPGSDLLEAEGELQVIDQR
jgi:hypothetical protein